MAALTTSSTPTGAFPFHGLPSSHIDALQFFGGTIRDNMSGSTRVSSGRFDSDMEDAHNLSQQGRAPSPFAMLGVQQIGTASFTDWVAGEGVASREPSQPMAVPMMGSSRERSALCGRDHASRGSSCALALLRGNSGSLQDAASMQLEDGQEGSSYSDRRCSIGSHLALSTGRRSSSFDEANLAHVSSSQLGEGSGRSFSMPLPVPLSNASNGSSCSLAAKIEELGMCSAPAQAGSNELAEGGTSHDSSQTDIKDDVAAWEGRVHNGLPRIRSLPLLYGLAATKATTTAATLSSYGTADPLAPCAGNGPLLGPAKGGFFTSRSAGSPAALGALIESVEEEVEAEEEAMAAEAKQQ